MALLTRNPSRVTVLNRSEALTRNLLTAARHTTHWNGATVAADYAKENSRPTGKRARRG